MVLGPYPSINKWPAQMDDVIESERDVSAEVRREATQLAPDARDRRWDAPTPAVVLEGGGGEPSEFSSKISNAGGVRFLLASTPSSIRGQGYGRHRYAR